MDLLTIFIWIAFAAALCVGAGITVLSSKLRKTGETKYRRLLTAAFAVELAVVLFAVIAMIVTSK